MHPRAHAGYIMLGDVMIRISTLARYYVLKIKDGQEESGKKDIIKKV